MCKQGTASIRRIVFYVPNLMPGGAERVCVNLANYISEHFSAEVYLMARMEGTYEYLVGDNVKRIDLNGKNLFSMIRTLRSLTPDIIMSTTESANFRHIIIKLFLSPKTLSITRAANICYSWKTRNGLKSKVHMYLGNKSYRYSDYVIANSPDTAKSLMDVCGVNECKIFTIGNPVFSLEENKKNNQPEPEDVKKPYILAVGSFKSQKRYDLMIKAFNCVVQSCDINLCIIGEDGGQKENVVNLIKQYGMENRVILLGAKKDLSPYYRNATCMIHTAAYEGFGNVLVEALSYGLAVICFDVPGGPNYILNKGEYGYLVPFNDISKMVEIIISVIKGERRMDSQALVDRAATFSIENKSVEYYCLFRKLYYAKYGEIF